MIKKVFSTFCKVAITIIVLLVISFITMGVSYFFDVLSVTQLNAITANISYLNASTGRGATYVIASVNATSMEKDQADYICDGIDDDVQIQSAIDAMSGGGFLKFSSGVFYLSNEISLTDKDGVTIEGSGIFGTTTPSVGTVLYQTAETKSVFLLSSSQGVVFRNFSSYAATTNGTTGFKVTNISNNIHFEGLYLLRFDTLFDVSGESYEITWDRVQGGQGTTNYGIKMVSGQDISVTKSFFPTTSPTGKSIYLSDVDWASIMGNTLRDSGYGVYVTNGCKYIRIIGNTIGGNDNTGIEIYATGASSSTIILISGNTFDSNASNATSGAPEDSHIYTHADSGKSISWLTITDNIFRRGVGIHPYYSMYLSNVGQNRVTDNQLVLGQYNVPIEITSIASGFTYPYHNDGYITENSGAANITNGSNAVTVLHGLVTTPNFVAVSSSSNETGWLSWSANSTSVNITASANISANRLIYWRATLGAGN